MTLCEAGRRAGLTPSPFLWEPEQADALGLALAGRAPTFFIGIFIPQHSQKGRLRDQCEG